jgi:hypothetical protein
MTIGGAFLYGKATRSIDRAFSLLLCTAEFHEVWLLLSENPRGQWCSCIHLQ